MDIEDKDVVIAPCGSTMYQMRIVFEDEDGNVTKESPEKIYEQVKNMVRKNTKEVKSKVCRVSDLLLGFYPQGMSFYFANGWYFRKAIELLEKKHGKSKIEFDSEDISKDQLRTIVVKYMKKHAKQINETAEEIMKNGLPDETFEEDD